MRRFALGAASVAGLVVLGSFARAGDKADTKLPWNPLQDSAVGDWACWTIEVSGSGAKSVATTKVTAVAPDKLTLESSIDGAPPHVDTLPRGESPLVSKFFDLKSEQIVKTSFADEKKTAGGHEFACTKVTVELRSTQESSVTTEIRTSWLSKEVKAGGLVACELESKTPDGAPVDHVTSWLAGYGTADKVLFGKKPEDVTAEVKKPAGPAPGDAPVASGPPRTDDAVHRILESAHVTKDLREDTFVESLAYLSQEHDLNYALDASLDATKPISLSFSDVVLKDALTEWAKKVHAIYEVWDGVVFFQSAKHPKKFPPKPDLLPKTRDLADTARVSMDFVQVDIDTVAETLAGQTKVPFSAGKNVKAQVTCHLKGVPLETALEVICRTSDLKLTKKSDVQVFESSK
jgi:hypothetical protein